LNSLDRKIQQSFPGESVNKIPRRYRVFAGINLPSFIKDWLIKKFTYDNGDLDTEGLLSFIDKHIPHKKSNIKSKLRTHREEVNILTRFIVENDIDILRQSGFSDEEILNINLITCYFNFVNRIALGLGVTFSKEELFGYNY